MNAVNNFNLQESLYSREFFQEIAANLEEHERKIIDVGEVKIYVCMQLVMVAHMPVRMEIIA